MATRTLALLNQQADAVRGELAVLRKDLERVRLDFTAIPAAQLVEANERLVLSALRSQGIADAARRRLGELTRGTEGSVALPQSSSGELARTEYLQRVADLREANEQLVVAALSSQEMEADAEVAHARQIKYLAMAAHELRNPLLPLRLAARMITHERADHAVLVKAQATINNQVNHMARLIGDLLDGSRISTGKFRLEKSLLDLSAILQESIDTCQPAMDARRHVFVRLGTAQALPVMGDSVRLVQVFSNLLENAAKYTLEDGRIKLNAQLRGDEVVVTVCDNGVGISAEALPNVFELFAQDAHASALNNGGLGIGLAVVRELVQAHGGTVVVTSGGKDQGSEFTVALPLAQPDGAA